MKAKKRARKKNSVRLRGRPHPEAQEPEDILLEPEEEELAERFLSENEPDDFEPLYGDDDESEW